MINGKELEKIFELAEKHDLRIFSDEIYLRIFCEPTNFFSISEIDVISWRILSDLFLVFPKISRYGLSSEEFAKTCLEEVYIAIFPRIYLSKNGESYLRLTYTQNIDILCQPMSRLKACNLIGNN